MDNKENTTLNYSFKRLGGCLSLLVAADEANVIGKNNQLPWHLPADLKYFKNLTWGMPVVMGRKTFDSIGRPLQGRKNIVITRNKNWAHENVEAVHTIEEAIRVAENYAVKEVFIIGGAEIFKSVLSQAGRIYLTRIHHYFEGDVYLPPLPATEWELVKIIDCKADEKNRYDYSFQTWERK
jgi:dihydrofolate reductase